MIFRKPTVIQIKAEEDIYDIQSANKITASSNPLKGRTQDLRGQMDIERNPHNQPPFTNDSLYGSLMNNIHETD